MAACGAEGERPHWRNSHDRLNDCLEHRADIGAASYLRLLPTPPPPDFQPFPPQHRPAAPRAGAAKPLHRGACPPRPIARRRRCLPRHGAVVRRQGGKPRRAAVLPHGRFLRNVLRRRRGRRGGARHRADQPRRARRTADRHVRRAGACRRSLSRPADPPRLPRGRGRADGGPQDPHRQGADPPRGGAADHPRHADRRRAAGAGPAQPAARPGAVAGAAGAAWLDVSTGLFETQAVAADALPALLGRLDPAEILAPPGVALGDWEPRRGAELPAPPPLVARRRLAEAFGVASLDAFGSFSDAEAVAPCWRSTTCARPRPAGCRACRRPAPLGEAGRLDLDAATRASLEMTRARDGGTAHTLLAAVQRTLDRRRGAAAGRVAGRPADRSRRRSPTARMPGPGCSPTPRRPAALRAALRRAPTWRARSAGCRSAAAARATSARFATGWPPARPRRGAGRGLAACAGRGARRPRAGPGAAGDAAGARWPRPCRPGWRTAPSRRASTPNWMPSARCATTAAA